MSELKKIESTKEYLIRVAGLVGLSLMVTSTISGFVAAYLNDFYPSLEGMHIFFAAKAIIGNMISLGFVITHFSYKEKSISGRYW